MSLILLLAIALSSTLTLGKHCTNVIVPVEINARQGVFDVPELKSNADATWFAQNFTDIERNFTSDVLVGYQTVRGAYKISAKFCRPDGGTGDNATVQFLTHGIVSSGFDE